MSQAVPPDAKRLLEERVVLGRAARLLASAADFGDTLKQTLAACLPALGDYGFFDVVVSTEEVRRTVAAHGAPDIEKMLAGTRWEKQWHPKLNLCALSTGEPALHPEIGEDWYRQVAQSEAHLAAFRALGFRSMISVPMRYQDQLVGALTLFMGASGRRHGPEHMELAGELALLAAPVVVNARLVAAERQARTEAEAARRHLEQVARVGALLARSLDPEDTLQAIASSVVPAIADWCRIDLLDERGEPRRRLAYHSDPQRSARAMALAQRLRASPDIPGTMRWSITHGQPYYGRFDVPPACDDPAVQEYAQAFGKHTFYVVPLVARGRIIGAMRVVQAESGRDIGEADQALVRELAQRAALALDNARAYSEAEAARREAERASRAKDEFLAMLGHELRNPLAPISTALELMAHRDADAHLEERRVIARQVAHLSRLIDDLLDVSRITQGKVRLQRARLDLRSVVADAMEQTQPLFERRPHRLQVRVPELPVPVHGDATRLTQVLCNLLANAAKFTPAQGHVHLSLTMEGAEAVLAVTDTGRGIAPELLPKVFELFVQGQQSLDRRGGGLGLGLAIVRMLVEMHGGSVDAASEGQDRGSCFTVRLPVIDKEDAMSEPQPGPSASAAPAGGSARLMIVDDNTDAAETLADLLRVLGYEVRCAGDGASAFTLLDEYVPDLALLDIGLPGEDGYALAQRMRADPRMARAKLVALTGYGSDTDRARALDASFDEHLVKPVGVEKLMAVLQQLVG